MVASPLSSAVGDSQHGAEDTPFKAPGPADIGLRARGRDKSDSRRIGGGVALLLAVGAFTVVPVLFVVLNSFNTNGPGQSFDFGLAGWRQLFDDSRTPGAVGYSFLLSVRVPMAIVVAFLIAWAIIRMEIPGRRFIEYSLWLAFFLPVLPMTLGWILLADPDYGLLNAFAEGLPGVSGPIFNIYSVPGILWVHVTLSTVPIMVILLSPALRQLDSAYEEAASMSGVGTARTLRRVTVPMLAPAILTAFLAGFIKSLEVFEIERVLGTPAGIDVFSTRIYDLVSFEPPQYPHAMALSTMFLAVILCLALAYQLLLRRYGGHATITGKSVRLQPRARTGWAYAITSGIMVYLAIGVFLPLAVLLAGSFNTLFGFFSIADPWTTQNWTQVFGNPLFMRASSNTLWIGLVAAGAGTLIFALLAWVLVRSRLWGRWALGVMVWLPWAVPGVLLGVSLLTLLLMTPGLRELFGTIVPLIAVMVIRELPLGVQMLRSSVEQVSSDLEEAAAMSGVGFLRTFRRVTLPLISPMLVSVFVLVFMSTVRDIGTMVLLSTPQNRTLSLLLFEYASSGDMESAAVIGVLIAAVSMVIVSVALRFGLKIR